MGTDEPGSGRIETFKPDGTKAVFLTGISPTDIVFDTQGILGGGMFIADMNANLNSTLPGRIWWVTVRVPSVGGTAIAIDEFGVLALYIGLASTIAVAVVVAAVCVKRVKRREEKL
jgi:hypothetical protein